MFWLVATLSGLFGLAISFTSMWFLHQTGPTTHRYDGFLNEFYIGEVSCNLSKVGSCYNSAFSLKVLHRGLSSTMSKIKNMLFLRSFNFKRGTVRVSLEYKHNVQLFLMEGK